MSGKHHFTFILQHKIYWFIKPSVNVVYRLLCINEAGADGMWVVFDVCHSVSVSIDRNIRREWRQQFPSSSVGGILTSSIYGNGDKTKNTKPKEKYLFIRSLRVFFVENLKFIYSSNKYFGTAPHLPRNKSLFSQQYGASPFEMLPTWIVFYVPVAPFDSIRCQFSHFSSRSCFLFVWSSPPLELFAFHFHFNVSSKLLRFSFSAIQHFDISILPVILSDENVLCVLIGTQNDDVAALNHSAFSFGPFACTRNWMIWL